MKPLWATALMDELSRLDSGPPNHRWWASLLPVWERACEVDESLILLVARLVEHLAAEIGDTELEALAAVVAAGRSQYPTQRILELNNALRARRNAARRRGRGSGEKLAIP